MEKKLYEEVKMEDCPFYYKGYMASVGYSRVENHFYGEVEGIGNVIAFTGKSIDELETNFKEAVDAYLTECEKEGQTPDKQFTGDVLVHLTPDFHCRLALVCEEIGVDIQEIRPYSQRLAEKVCCENELLRLERACDRAAEFAKIWAMKESFVKMNGRGIGYSLKKADTTVLHFKEVIEKDGFFIVVSEE